MERQTHRNLIEPPSGSLHPKVMLASSFLLNSSKFSSDSWQDLLKATRGQRQNSGVLAPGVQVKKNLVYAGRESDELWKSSLAKELLDVRTNKLEISGFNEDEVEEMLAYTCTS